MNWILRVLKLREYAKRKGVLKILVFCKRFGAPTHTFLYEELKAIEQFADVQLTCLIREGSEQFPVENEVALRHSGNTIRKRIEYRLRKRNLLYNEYDRKLSRSLRAAVQQFTPDIIHCNFGPNALLFLDNYPADDIPVSVVFHGYDASMLLQQSPAYVKKWKRIARRKNISAIYVSRFLQKNMHAAGIRFAREEVIYLGVDTEKFRRVSEPQRRPRIFLQVSSFREKKGHEYTIRAFARFLEAGGFPDVQLVLAGDGPTREPMQQLVRELAVEKQVHFPGLVTNQEAKEWMEKASAFVHHSVTATDGDTEGLPTVLKEAMAMEMPVLTTRHSGIPELVEDGVNGVLVEERDVEGIKKAFLDISGWTLPKIENRKKIISDFSINSYRSALHTFFSGMQNLNKL